jgi:hypothetical protein
MHIAGDSLLRVNIGRKYYLYKFEVFFIYAFLSIVP